jgi:lipoprotein NlpI
LRAGAVRVSSAARREAGAVAHDVFISYSTKDKPSADAACAVLEGAGVRCWIAPRDITPGADWGESIIDAIAEAKVFVLVFSAHANESRQIKREVERAVNRGIPIIPLRIEDVAPARSLEYFISTPHWLDAFSPPLQKHLTYLAEIVQRLLVGDAAQPRPVPIPSPPVPALSPWAALTPRRIAVGAAVVLVLVVLAVRGMKLVKPHVSGADSSVPAASSAAADAAQPPSTAGLSPTWAHCVGTDPDASIQDCTTIIESGRESRRNLAVAYYNRAFSFEKKGEYQLAVEDYSQVLRAQPKDPETLNNRGEAYSEMGDFPHALADFDKSIRLTANNALAFDNRGYVYLQQGQYALAMTDFNQAIHLDPTMGNAFINRCTARARTGQQLDLALADCTLALSHLPTNVEGLDARGLAHLRLNQPDLAVADFNAALKVNPKFAASLYGRALAIHAKTGGTDADDLAAALAV